MVSATGLLLLKLSMGNGLTSKSTKMSQVTEGELWHWSKRYTSLIPPMVWYFKNIFAELIISSVAEIPNSVKKWPDFRHTNSDL